VAVALAPTRLVDLVAEPTSVAIAQTRLASLSVDSRGDLGNVGVTTLAVATDPRSSFNFTVPCRTVSSCDANERPIFTARADDGGPLPEWLSFDPYTGTFSGKAPAQTPSLKVQVSTVGAAGAAAWTPIQLNFVGSTSKL
jgi:large repetitive protein